ncbi:MAG: hypothetical protein ABIH41_04815 [Nanoarchaeota archaeon]
MGSYDTHETTPASRPLRRPISSTPSREEPAETTPASRYQSGQPILMSVGGGLTPARIVAKLPEEYAERTVIEGVKYMLTPENLRTTEDTSIAEAVRSRMEQPEYRAVINGTFNYHNERLRVDLLKAYLNPTTRQTEGGEVKLNMCDIAIVSHDEGGTYRTIDSILE